MTKITMRGRKNIRNSQLPSSAKPSHAAASGSQISSAKIIFIITEQVKVVLKQEVFQIQTTLINNNGPTNETK